MEDVLFHPEFPSDRVEYGSVRSYKEPLLEQAAATFIAEAAKKEWDKYLQFVKENQWWLEDYALYQVLCRTYNDSRWFEIWPKKVRLREEVTLQQLKKNHAKAIENIQVQQYFFFMQWAKVKHYANKKGIQIIGDIPPIFVAPDSVDAWTNRDLLKMDKEGRQTASSGVPPDAFSDEGQLWGGNPVYDWQAHREQQFSWWIKRIEKTLEICDIVRIDHFRGFAAYWEVPKGGRRLP